MTDSWTPVRLLEAWGLRMYGRLKNPHIIATHGSIGADFEEQAATYVESVCGFSKARPVLHWHYAEGQPLESFQIEEPGEPFMLALYRHDWAYLACHQPYQIPGMVHLGFLRELERIAEGLPFRPVAAVERVGTADAALEIEHAGTAPQSSTRMLGRPEKVRHAYVMPEKDLRFQGYQVRKPYSRR